MDCFPCSEEQISDDPRKEPFCCIPGHNDAIDTKHSFRDAKLLFTEEQVKAETARCLGCGASLCPGI